jgi:tetratricopeptide (TPR) repeat protein
VVNQKRRAIEQMNNIQKNILAWVIALAAALGSSASAADEVSAVAMKKFRQGVKEFNAEQYETAVKSFREAYDLNPTWKIFYNIGQCEAALKRYGLAIEAFERYLAVGGDEVAVERRDEVLAELSRLRQLVGGLNVRGPDGLAVFVGDVRRGETPLGMAIAITAGVVHKVRLEQAGNVVFEQEITVRGGAVFDIDASDFVRPKATGVPQTAAPMAHEAEPGKRRLEPALFWIGLGATAAFAGATIGLDFAVGAKIDEAKKTIKNDRLKDSAQKMQIAERVFGGLAVAAGITSVVLVFFTDFKGDKESSVAVSPFGDGQSGGLMVQGRF